MIQTQEALTAQVDPHDYRLDIDGLRAVAVLSVVAFHAFPSRVRGGFVGVDVFFVISGYLISGIIFRKVLQKQFSYREFYSRRIRRIFPALVLMLLCCLAYGYFRLFSIEFARMTAHVAAAAAFAANLFSWQQAGYFDTDAATKPMLHLWSLGVEEQYYIVWPIVVSALMPRVRRFYLVIAAVFLGSFCANLALTWRDPAGAFFLPIPRFWELMLGSGLAYLENVGRRASGDGGFARLLQRWRSSSGGDVVSVAGLGLLAGSICAINSKLAFPGWWALPPTAGAALLLAAGPNAWINRRLLSTKVAVFFGLISYPLYLWHWPILAFLSIRLGHDLGRTVRCAAVLASVLLAWLTQRLIEQPIRFGPHGRVKVIALTTAAAGVGILALIGSRGLLRASDARDQYVAFFDDGQPGYRYGRAHNLFVLDREECNFLDLYTNSPRDRIAESCTAPAHGSASVFLWGDSHIQHLASGLRATLPSNVSLLQVATSGCPPSMNPKAATKTLACSRSNEYARESIARVRPDIVVLAQRSGHLETDWDRFAAGVRSLGARAVILVGPNPKWDRPLYAIVARQFWPSPPEWIGAGLLQEDREADQVLKRRYHLSHNLVYVSIIDEMCRPDACRAFVGADKFEDIVTHDESHFTTTASRYVAARTVTPAVEALLARQP